MGLKGLLICAFTQVTDNLAKICAPFCLILETSSSEEGERTKKNVIKSLNDVESIKKNSLGFFQMPLHYPRYTKADYEKMEEWKVDLLLEQYGIYFEGDLDEKRAFAIGAFLWPNQC